MRVRYSVYLFIVIAIISVGCGQEEEQAAPFPVVGETTAMISSVGADLSAGLTNFDLASIRDGGFVWGPTDALNITVNNIVRVGKPVDGKISGKVRSGLKAGSKYFVRAFVEVNNNVVYGTPLQITSQGSEGPVVDSAFPTTFKSGDRITLKGKNFGTKLADVAVYIGYNGLYPFVGTVTSVTDTEIVFNANSVVDNGNELYSISVTCSGSTSYLPNALSIIAPRLLSMQKANVCKPMVFTAENLLLYGRPTIKVNGVEVNGNSITFTNTSMTFPFTLPAGIGGALPSTIETSLIYRPTATSSVTKTLTITDVINLPVISSVYAPTFSPGNDIVIKGTNLPECGSSLSLFDTNGHYYPITSVSATEIRASIDKKPCSEIKLKLEANGYQVYNSINPFGINFSVSNYTSPNPAKPGDLIVIDLLTPFDNPASLSFSLKEGSGLWEIPLDASVISPSRYQAIIPTDARIVPTYDQMYPAPGFDLSIARPGCDSYRLAYNYKGPGLPIISFVSFNPVSGSLRVSGDRLFDFEPYFTQEFFLTDQPIGDQGVALTITGTVNDANNITFMIDPATKNALPTALVGIRIKTPTGNRFLPINYLFGW